jgi:hypothetical protein
MFSSSRASEHIKMLAASLILYRKRKRPSVITRSTILPSAAGTIRKKRETNFARDGDEILLRMLCNNNMKKKKKKKKRKKISSSLRSCVCVLQKMKENHGKLAKTSRRPKSWESEHLRPKKRTGAAAFEESKETRPASADDVIVLL